MKTIILKSAVASLALGLAGCTTEGAGDYSSSANFGSATANNTLAQSAYLSGGIFADLTASFRAAAPDMINFEFNKSDLDATARTTLVKQSAWIAANPAIKFRVYGHTDKVGTNAYNQALGLRRARAAVNFIVAQGVPRARLEAVASFGESRPLVDTNNAERLNRRTVTEIVGFVGGYVGDDFDGKVANRLYVTYTGGAGEAPASGTTD